MDCEFCSKPIPDNVAAVALYDDADQGVIGGYCCAPCAASLIVELRCDIRKLSDQ